MLTPGGLQYFQVTLAESQSWFRNRSDNDLVVSGIFSSFYDIITKCDLRGEGKLINVLCDFFQKLTDGNVMKNADLV